MDYFPDDDGFPFFAVPGTAVGVAFLPVLKPQYEFLHGRRDGPGGAWYAELCGVNPRVSWRTAKPADAPKLVLSGLTDADAATVAAGLGGRLPTAAEWRAADAHAAGPAPVAAMLADPKIHPAAKAWLRFAPPNATGKVAGGFEKGVLEWVTAQAGPGLYGRPRPEVFRVLLNPQIHPPYVRRSAERHPAFGLRLARPLPPAVP